MFQNDQLKNCIEIFACFTQSKFVHFYNKTMVNLFIRKFVKILEIMEVMASVQLCSIHYLTNLDKVVVFHLFLILF